MQNNKAIHSAVAGILALGAAATSTSVLAVLDQPENCTGIAKAGMNDCGALDGKQVFNDFPELKEGSKPLTVYVKGMKVDMWVEKDILFALIE